MTRQGPLWSVFSSGFCASRCERPRRDTVVIRLARRWPRGEVLVKDDEVVLLRRVPGRGGAMVGVGRGLDTRHLHVHVGSSSGERAGGERRRAPHARCYAPHTRRGGPQPRGLRRDHRAHGQGVAGAPPRGSVRPDDGPDCCGLGAHSVSWKCLRRKPISLGDGRSYARRSGVVRSARGRAPTTGEWVGRRVSYKRAERRGGTRACGAPDASIASNRARPAPRRWKSSCT